MKNYNPEEIEKKWGEYWEKHKVYKFNEKSKKKVYSIDTPPPTVSGKMHIGHAFSYSQQDFLVRFRRMLGDNVYYPFGTDDNGLPTERLVEKEKKVKAKDMSREKFIELCLSFLKEELPGFIQDWKNLGISCDFEAYYSTINPYSRKISQWSFLDLYKKRRLERRDAPAMWCPECQTGISQVEAQDKEIESEFNDIVFKVDNKDLIISTTRPELLPACVAIFYHPSDKRFKKLKGKKALVPLFNFSVPIMEDIRAEPEKGTGIVMCCTFGDQTDMAWQKAHKLPIKQAITEDGKMNKLAGKYSGLSIKEARKQIIEDLKNAGLLKKQEKIKHVVNVHERCRTEIEFIKTKQWFVKYLDLKKNMLEWGKKFNWYPKYMKTRYDNWVKGLQWDWLISRQRYFGVPFPVWYCKKCGKVILAEEKDLPVDPLKDCPKKKCSCGSTEFEGEKDILDTWFTSSMTPRLAVQLLDKKLWDKVFPMSLRPQAHDIITFWLFNTTVKSNLHYRKNPFKDVAVSGFVLDPEGKKMSKSKGNIVEPREVFEKYGADALRYWAASSKLGEDLSYQEKDLITGKKFITKILNASKFAFMHIKRKPAKVKLEKIDEQFLNKVNNVLKEYIASFENYEYHKAKALADNLFWNDFANNYLEIIKDRVYNNKKGKNSALYALYESLLLILKLFAPITPFVTEEIYQQYYKKYEKEKSIHILTFPKIKTGKFNELNLFYEILTKVREEKAKNKKSVKAEIILYLEKKDMEKLKDLLKDLKAVTNSKEIKEGKFKVEFV